MGGGMVVSLIDTCLGRSDKERIMDQMVVCLVMSIHALLWQSHIQWASMWTLFLEENSAHFIFTGMLSNRRNVSVFHFFLILFFNKSLLTTKRTKIMFLLALYWIRYLCFSNSNLVLQTVELRNHLQGFKHHEHGILCIVHHYAVTLKIFLFF